MSLMPAVFRPAEAAAAREGFRDGTPEESWFRLEFFMAKAPDFNRLTGMTRHRHATSLFRTGSRLTVKSAAGLMAAGNVHGTLLW
jgi:hypothetical protein